MATRIAEAIIAAELLQFTDNNNANDSSTYLQMVISNVKVRANKIVKKGNPEEWKKARLKKKNEFF